MASGNTLLIWTPHNNSPPSSAFATLDTRNGHLVLEFDPAADEAAIFPGVLPRNYAGGGVTIVIGWMVDGATAGNAIWDTAFERNEDEGTDLDSDSFATAVVSAASAAPGTDGAVQYTSIAHTDGAQMDSVAAGEAFRLRVRRLGSTSALDTINSNDLQLLFVEVRET